MAGPPPALAPSAPAPVLFDPAASGDPAAVWRSFEMRLEDWSCAIRLAWVPPAEEVRPERWRRFFCALRSSLAFRFSSFRLAFSVLVLTLDRILFSIFLWTPSTVVRVFPGLPTLALFVCIERSAGLGLAGNHFPAEAGGVLFPGEEGARGPRAGRPGFPSPPRRCKLAAFVTHPRGGSRVGVSGLQGCGSITLLCKSCSKSRNVVRMIMVRQFMTVPLHMYQPSQNFPDPHGT